MSDNTTPAERPEVTVEAVVNNEPVEATVEPRLKLSDFLREECEMRSVKVGCEHGVCGACAVLVDGDLTKSCLTYTSQIAGAEIETAEGLLEDEVLHPIQEAFHEANALQCGFCTNGFVMATKALLEENPDPDDEDIERELGGNLCRCTGYRPIYDAVHESAAKLTESE